MNTRVLLCTIAVAGLIALSGCGKVKKEQATKVVEDATGITTIKQGEAMKKKIKDFEKTQQDRQREIDSIK